MTWWRSRLSPNEWLAKLPSTNARIFVTLVVFIATALVYLFLLIVGADAGIDESVFAMWLGFLSVFAGVDAYQFSTKRKTHMESPPTKPDIEDAKAGANAP